jgi:hypothetical protein
MRNVDTFFRGYRRVTIIDGATILCNSAGEKRLKLSMKLPLSGDQLVGMPSWVGEPFNAIAKPEFAGKHWASEMELDPMLLHVFMMPQSEKEAFTLESVRMTNFKIEHDAEDEHPNLILSFTAYIPRTGKVLKFADDNFGSSLFIRYEAAQQSLLDDNPNVQPIDEPKREEDGRDDDAEDEQEGGENGSGEADQQQETTETVLEPPSETSPAAEQPIHALSSPRRRRGGSTAQETVVQ